MIDHGIISLTETKGENSIIGVSLRGLDPESCFFLDKDKPVSYSKTEKNDHRKIAKYWDYIKNRYYNYIDNSDDKFYGSSIASIIVGESENPLDGFKVILE